jgi:hypothetical protein
MLKTKRTIWAVAAIIVFGLAGCAGGGGHSDLKSVVKDYNKAVEKFITDMDKADNGKSVAAAITGFGEAMKSIKPEMEKMEAKYPQLTQMSEVPEELGEDGRKMQELAMRMGAAMMKAMQYRDDPDVQAAQQALEDIM